MNKLTSNASWMLFAEIIVYTPFSPDTRALQRPTTRNRQLRQRKRSGGRAAREIVAHNSFPRLLVGHKRVHQCSCENQMARASLRCTISAALRTPGCSAHRHGTGLMLTHRKVGLPLQTAKGESKPLPRVLEKKPMQTPTLLCGKKHCYTVTVRHACHQINETRATDHVLAHLRGRRPKRQRAHR